MVWCYLGNHSFSGFFWGMVHTLGNWIKSAWSENNRQSKEDWIFMNLLSPIETIRGWGFKVYHIAKWLGFVFPVNIKPFCRKHQGTDRWSSQVWWRSFPKSSGNPWNPHGAPSGNSPLHGFHVRRWHWGSDLSCAYMIHRYRYIHIDIYI